MDEDNLPLSVVSTTDVLRLATAEPEQPTAAEAEAAGMAMKQRQQPEEEEDVIIGDE